MAEGRCDMPQQFTETYRESQRLSTVPGRKPVLSVIAADVKTGTPWPSLQVRVTARLERTHWWMEKRGGKEGLLQWRLRQLR